MVTIKMSDAGDNIFLFPTYIKDRNHIAYDNIRNLKIKTLNN